ncbi:hypothetical protein [Aureibacter tunicatorum]|uniref:Uncharacterized protein n=1 Tax=Aureibacter tunicatorum TaxID=866807 RepID=A0AAE4BT29_9BACT|nr:hypothetical protein [Aureibacter tunicatorum]MDR6239067.1 hypothetical protein [Aureibacter tunicatorum]BDD05007.1 hypothetical protein AUTU_24900 [Aureibacter tunicatorum]
MASIKDLKKVSKHLTNDIIIEAMFYYEFSTTEEKRKSAEEIMREAASLQRTVVSQINHFRKQKTEKAKPYFDKTFKLLVDSSDKLIERLYQDN